MSNHFAPSRSTSYHVVPRRTTSYFSYHVVQRRTTSYHVVPGHTRSYHVVPRRTTSLHIVAPRNRRRSQSRRNHRGMRLWGSDGPSQSLIFSSVWKGGTFLRRAGRSRTSGSHPGGGQYLRGKRMLGKHVDLITREVIWHSIFIYALVTKETQEKEMGCTEHFICAVG